MAKSRAADLVPESRFLAVILRITSHEESSNSIYAFEDISNVTVG